MSTIKNARKVIDIWNLFRDYDLSLICSSKCDDAYLECVTACGSSDCFMECNRAAVTCGNGKYLEKCMRHTVCSLHLSLNYY